MTARYVPLMACVKCGTVRRADVLDCPGIVPLVGRCWEVEGYKVGLLDHDEVAVDTGDRMTPLAPGQGFR